MCLPGEGGSEAYFWLSYYVNFSRDPDPLPLTTTVSGSALIYTCNYNRISTLGSKEYFGGWFWYIKFIGGISGFIWVKRCIGKQLNLTEKWIIKWLPLQILQKKKPHIVDLYFGVFDLENYKWNILTIVHFYKAWRSGF